MYDEILVATDGSEFSSAAADHGIELARLAGGRVHAVYVIETRTAYDNAIVDPAAVRENLREDGREALDSIEETARAAGVDATTTISEGIPADVLLEYAAEHDVDVLVAGARGRSDFKRALLGSTTERLLDEASVPLFVVTEQSSSDSTA